MLYQTKNQHGGDVYGGGITLDFSANTNPLGTPPGVLEAVCRALPQLHRYPDPYCRRLVQAIAAHEQVPASYILCGNGAADLIYTYCAALRPRTAVELAPTFVEYGAGLAQVGCRVERYFLHQAQNFDLDERFLSFLEEKKPEAVFLCNPNNPTGRLMEKELLYQLLARCRQVGAMLAVDQCFLELTAARPDRLTDQLAGGNLILFRALTKSYALAGLRLGYCLCGDRALLEQMARILQPWPVSIPAQMAGECALQSFPRWPVTCFPEIEGERNRLQAALEELGLWVCPSESCFLLFCGPEDLGRRLRENGILVRDCANYAGLEPGWYRVGLRTPEENGRLIAALSTLLRGE